MKYAVAPLAKCNLPYLSNPSSHSYALAGKEKRCENEFSHRNWSLITHVTCPRSLCQWCLAQQYNMSQKHHIVRKVKTSDVTLKFVFLMNILHDGDISNIPTLPLKQSVQATFRSDKS